MMMIDVQCQDCGKRFGWSGRFINRPPCPRCGRRPPQKELEAIDEKMDAERQLLETHPGRATAQQRWKQRIKAGLTLRQAAKILGITPSDLADYENCRAELSADLCEKMASAYGVGE